MRTLAIVVGLVRHEDQVLLLKRSAERLHSPRKWEPVGGFLRFRESAEAAVLRCAEERAGLQTSVLRAGAAFECEDAGAWWIVKPFLLESTHAAPEGVRLGPDHVDHRWVTPLAALTLDCVDGFAEDLEALGLVSRDIAASPSLPAVRAVGAA